MPLEIASFNVRTLKNEVNTLEFEAAIEKSNIKIMGLSEIRRSGKKIIETREGNILCYVGNEKGQAEVGFWVDKNFKKSMIEFQGITDRIAVMKLKLKRNSRLTLIQVYAPIANSTEKDCEQFYQELMKIYTIQKSGWKDLVIIMGDFNSQIGSRKKEEETIIGPYNYGKRNDRGEKLVQFCLENNLKIINTWFKK